MTLNVYYGIYYVSLACNLPVNDIQYVTVKRDFSPWISELFMEDKCFKSLSPALQVY